MKRKLNEWGQYQTEWEQKAQKALIGKKVTAVRYLSKEEKEQSFSDWYSVPLVVFFDDGTYLIPMRDDEGNDAGALLTNEEVFPVF